MTTRAGTARKRGITLATVRRVIDAYNLHIALARRSCLDPDDFSSEEEAVEVLALARSTAGERKRMWEEE